MEILPTIIEHVSALRRVERLGETTHVSLAPGFTRRRSRDREQCFPASWQLEAPWLMPWRAQSTKRAGRSFSTIWAPRNDPGRHRRLRRTHYAYEARLGAGGHAVADALSRGDLATLVF